MNSCLSFHQSGKAKFFLVKVESENVDKIFDNVTWKEKHPLNTKHQKTKSRIGECIFGSRMTNSFSQI